MKNKLISHNMLLLLICSTILMLLIFPIQLSAKDLKGINIIPDYEKRSSIQAVDGYSYLSENMTLAETRAAAFANAKRQALEMARTYIQSKTKVEDFVAKYDLIWASSEGEVTILEQKDHGIEDNNRYHVWIKAEVEYELRPKLQQSDYDDNIGNIPLTVKVWTSKKHYKEGESIIINIQGNHNFYARIVDIASNGDIIQLLPNDFRRISFFEAGKVYKIPDKGDQFNLRVVAPFGKDQVIVYASEVPLGDVAMEKADKGLGQYRNTMDKLATQTRGVKVESLKEGDKSVAEFYEAIWVFTTGQ